MASKEVDGDTTKKRFSTAEDDNDEEEDSLRGATAGRGDSARSLAPRGSLRSSPCHPQFVLRGDAPALPAVSPTQVATEANQVFQSFVVQRFAMEQERGNLPAGTPTADLTRSNPLGVEARIGMRLAEFGDEINQLYGGQFSQMFKLLSTTDDNADTHFRTVAQLLFKDNVITWGRVLAIFYFAYRIAVDRMTTDASGFISRVASWFADFLTFNRITDWVASQGGWLAVFSLIIDYTSSEWRFATAAFLTGSACVLALYFLSRRYLR